MKFFSLVFFSLVSLLLSGCINAPTRLDVSDFYILNEGKISPMQKSNFADCLLDGFDKSHTGWVNMINRQQRRTDSIRVESLLKGDTILISVDVFDNGRVVLYESRAAKFINTAGEKASFEKCLSSYKTDK